MPTVSVSGINIQGLGRGVTTIISNITGAISKEYTSDVFLFKGNSTSPLNNIRVSDLTIIGHGNDSMRACGVETQFVCNSTFENLEISNTSYPFVFLCNSSSFNTVDNCYGHDGFECGFEIRQDSWYNMISNCRVYGLTQGNESFEEGFPIVTNSSRNQLENDWCRGALMEAFAIRTSDCRQNQFTSCQGSYSNYGFLDQGQGNTYTNILGYSNTQYGMEILGVETLVSGGSMFSNKYGYIVDGNTGGTKWYNNNAPAAANVTLTSVTAYSNACTGIGFFQTPSNCMLVGSSAYLAGGSYANIWTGTENTPVHSCLNGTSWIT